jgi:hypothetical protein
MVYVMGVSASLGTLILRGVPNIDAILPGVTPPGVASGVEAADEGFATIALRQVLRSTSTDQTAISVLRRA